MGVFYALYLLMLLFEFMTVSFIVAPHTGILYVVSWPTLCLQSFIKCNVFCAKIFSSLHVAFMVGTFTALLTNGFVSFQWAEDGSNTSIWVSVMSTIPFTTTLTFFQCQAVRISCLVAAAIGFIVSFGTMTSKLSLSPKNTTALFFVYFVYPALCVMIYFCSQIVLVFRMDINRMWPLGSLILGFIFFLSAQLFVLILSPNICFAGAHFFDGIMFGSFFHLFTVMMVYKYWDAVTEEDFEFSLGSKNEWRLKDPRAHNSFASDTMSQHSGYSTLSSAYSGFSALDHA
jgi:hypothetical protein